MLFNDPIFLFIFLPATVFSCTAVRRFLGPRAVLALLVFASILFYGWWNPIFLPLLGGLAWFNFALAQRITADRQRGRLDRLRFLLPFGITVDLLALGYFKYTDFLIGTADAVFSDDFPVRHIVLPLGLSFFTFQKIAYLVDASRGDVQKHDFLEYCFFVMFFPQLIAGPIVHHREIFPQIQRPGAFSVQASHLAIGLTIFLIGLFKKVVVADHLSPIVADAFGAAAAGEPIGSLQAWRSATAYTLQLYFDFSGYSDMAIGAARLFGIRLPVNFQSPYQATSIIDFWQHWHMTLSRFLRDYLYIPLGGNRKGTTRRYLNLMLTMTIGGLWHGAAWTFVLWGFLHGSYLIANHAWRAVWVPIDSWWSRAVARLLTLVAVIVAFVTFRAPSLEVALGMYRAMVGLPQDLPSSPESAATSLIRLSAKLGGEPGAGQIASTVSWAILWLAVLWFVPNTQQLMSRFQPALDDDSGKWLRQPLAVCRVSWLRPLFHWQPSAIGAVVIGATASLAGLSLQHVSEFLYFQF
jgi:alginate O-acetyltransferase complex protein AlgI